MKSVLVSDGKTLWFYNPFAEQATATWLKDATGDAPLCSLPVTSPATGGSTTLKQNGDEFVLTPKGSNGNLKQFRHH
ncbi:outer membrane lipoprotein chaperone LolA [Shigella flexneri]